jgi:biopolymer transport protein ExbD
MRVRIEDDETVEVQMAPLIDCVFLLISFFLVATTLKKIEKELPLELPQAAAAVSKQVDENMTVVSIDRDGNLFLGSEPVGQGYLGRRLRELAGQDLQHRIRIDADRDAPVWAAVQVLDICNFENLRNVGIRTKQKEG